MNKNFVILLGIIFVFTNTYANKTPAGLEKIVNKLSIKATEWNYLLNFDLSDYKLYSVPNLGNFYIDTFDDTIKGHIGHGLIWEPKISALIEYYSKPASITIDVGSFIGSHTMIMSRAVGPKGKVIGFEPLFKSFCECAINLAINNCFNANIYNYALSSKEYTSEIVVINGGEAITHLNDDEFLTQISLLNPNNYCQTVQVKTLDSFNFKNVSLIKIDTEGHQDEVISGALNTIKRNKPVIIFEANDPSLDDRNNTAKYLESLDYICMHIEASDWLAIPIKDKE